MRWESRDLFWALCASCVFHGALLFALEGSGRGDASLVREDGANGQSLTVTLAPIAAAQEPDTQGPRDAEHAAASLPLPFGAAPPLWSADSGSRGAALPTPAPPVYFPFGELDRPPRYQRDIDLPPVPQSELPSPGRLVLVLFIDARGNVDKVEVDASDLPTIYEKTAVESFSKANFVPAEKNGQPVNSRVRVEIRYD